MNISDLIWLPEILDKLGYKHNVRLEEVEEIFENRPKFRFSQSGDTEGEDVYLAHGRTDAGRYLVVAFIYKQTHEALVLSARDMANKERRWYGRK